eukprot:8129841-Ditylum_brightwellii.AAC.1
MALDPFRVHMIGPKYDALGGNFWHMIIGKAVYDRITNEFIACVSMTVSPDIINDVLAEFDDPEGK